jgi:hypothetical protein
MAKFKPAALLKKMVSVSYPIRLSIIKKSRIKNPSFPILYGFLQFR